MEALANLPGYQLTAQLYAGNRTLVYRGIRLSDHRPVAIKLLRNEYPSFNELLQFRNQYAIAKDLDSPGIIQPLALEPYRNGYALILEDFGGISLANYLQTSRRNARNEKFLEIKDFLNIALQLTKILDYLYQKRIIHKDIKPGNILINPETQEIKLIDFSISSLLPREIPEIKNPNILEGTLAYLSPEQTGRMNRGIDYRSDFYSLGVTFYELLSGQLPFKADEALKLVHDHLAKQPTPLHLLKPEIPPILSEIVGKLMAKNAEDRYQSALGLERDLEICWHQWNATGQIEPFALGQRDLTDRFTIPERLYGRETEISRLLETFERIANASESGNQGSELMLVSGPSGVGKTAIVNEIQKPIVRQRGYFIKGKYERFQQNVPFSGFVQAFRDLMEQLISESDAEIARWKEKILKAVGDNGQVLSELIPELEQIVGQQDPVAELSGTASQNRFNLLLQEFVNVFARQEHPLAIFLDDLQWADSASLNLLKTLLKNSRYLLLLCSYRQNEVSPVHPLILTVKEIEALEIPVTSLELQPLNQDDLNHLVADTLKCDRELAQPLTILIEQKTQGNPFFAIQFLKFLYEEGLVNFDWEIRHWQCDIARVKALAMTSEVVEFTVSQLQKLPPATREVLKLAACIGSEFDLNLLAIVLEKSPAIAAAALWQGLQSGLVIPTAKIYKFFTQWQETEVSHPMANPTYRFLHDRVQQAAYSLISPDQKLAVHLRIGQLLQKNASTAAFEEHLFEIVGHLNIARELIVEPSEREALAQLNLQAGQKARKSTAYAAARTYLQTGIELLSDEGWQTQYELALALSIAATEAAYLEGDLEEMERRAISVLERAHTVLDKVGIYHLQIAALAAQSRSREAIVIARNALAQLGIDLPTEINEAEMEKILQKIAAYLHEWQIEDLQNLPAITSPEMRAALKILGSIFAPVLLGNPALLPLLCAQMVSLSLEFGNAPTSPIGYVGYGWFLCVFFGDEETGYRFGKLAVNLSERPDVREFKASVLCIFTCFLQHRREGFKAMQQTAKEGYKVAIEVGNLLYAGYNLSIYLHNLFLSGAELETVMTEIAGYKVVLAQFKQDLTLTNILTLERAASNFLKVIGEPDCLSGEGYDEGETISHYERDGEFSSVAFAYIQKLLLACYFHCPAAILDYIAKVESIIDGISGTYFIPLFYFYAALGCMACCSPRQREETLERVEAYQAILWEYAQDAPQNYLNKWHLVAAEKCRLLGEKTEAIEHYDRAIELSRSSQFLNEEALSNELAAKFCLAWGKEKIAQSYALEAYYNYSTWGARAKVTDLEQKYPLLLKAILQPERTSNAWENLRPLVRTTNSLVSRSTNNTTNDLLLDFPAVVRAIQAVSQEIQFEHLLERLMQLALANAGAQGGCLLLYRDNQWFAAARAQSEGIEILDIPLEEYSLLPRSAIDWVVRNDETVAFDNLSSEAKFMRDSYVATYQPQSALCVPISRQGKTIGVLYLENNLTVGAFTYKQVGILKLLATQAAISIENARLYQQVENHSQNLAAEVEKKTQYLNQKASDLECALKNLRETQSQLIQSEKMSALGQLVAGIAHEINNPINFIQGNLVHAEQYALNLLSLLALYEKKQERVDPEIQEKREEIDVDFIRDDIVNILQSMSSGSERILKIILNLRNFSRLDEAELKDVDLHTGIESCLSILQNRLKASQSRSEIEVVRNYGILPKVTCYASEMNQVFLSLLANAIDALQEMRKTGRPPEIAIRTETLESDWVRIAIADNGMGIPLALQDRIFDPFFTTKPVGSGTGLGLSVSFAIIKKHGGRLTCQSRLGEGTEFVIEIPKWFGTQPSLPPQAS